MRLSLLVFTNQCSSASCSFCRKFGNVSCKGRGRTHCRFPKPVWWVAPGRWVPDIEDRRKKIAAFLSSSSYMLVWWKVQQSCHWMATCEAAFEWVSNSFSTMPISKDPLLWSYCLPFRWPVIQCLHLQSSTSTTLEVRLEDDNIVFTSFIISSYYESIL